MSLPVLSMFLLANAAALDPASLFAAGQGVRADEAAPLYVRDRVALKTAER